ncbi:MAG: glycosyltransferase family 4 protein [Candidatus Aminicenantes bacterium]|nr:glycosyltransferase family 4 protein [Candidatus Aminicenantes bacterium]
MTAAARENQLTGALLSRMPRGSELDRLLQPLPRHSQRDYLLKALKNLASEDDQGGFPRALRAAAQWLRTRQGPARAMSLLLRMETALGLRPPTLALYDHTLHIIGGGQKYGLTMLDALKGDFDITILTHRPMEPAAIRDWYGLDLSSCRYQTIEIPEFADAGAHIDPARITRRMANPFHRVSRLSGGFDIFINNSMNEMVFPLSGISAMVCHFPERRPGAYFYADRYDTVIFNSLYTAEWIEKKWKFTPHVHIYPPVDMPPPEKPEEKDPIILSVARFEQGGSKRQKEMVEAFLSLRRRFPEETRDWHLVLAGGSPENNPYLEDLKHKIRATGDTHIRLRVNITSDELHALYLRASVFWHLCGLHQTDPALVEHFGMTIGEAMQNGLVPIVFDGGGQREIVEPGVTGFRVRTLEELIRHTRRLINDTELRQRCGRAALESSRRFDRPRFTREVREFFNQRLKHYTDPQTS